MAGAGNLAGAHAAHKDVALPFWQPASCVERHTRDGNGRHPEHDRLLEAFVRRFLCLPWPLVSATEADDGPSIVATGTDDVDFISAVGTVLVLPDISRARMNSQAERCTMTKRIDLGFVAVASNER